MCLVLERSKLTPQGWESSRRQQSGGRPSPMRYRPACEGSVERTDGEDPKPRCRRGIHGPIPEPATLLRERALGGPREMPWLHPPWCGADGRLTARGVMKDDHQAPSLLR